MRKFVIVFGTFYAECVCMCMYLNSVMNKKNTMNECAGRVHKIWFGNWNILNNRGCLLFCRNFPQDRNTIPEFNR